MSTLHLVLAESALELVPEPLWDHPAVAKSARARNKRPREILLDDTYHHAAMRAGAKAGGLDDIERRGRPDIVHFCLLIALESRLNKEGRLAVWVHTRNDQLIQVDPGVRLQRAQHRFAGLMEQLLRDHAVPTPDKGDPLMQLSPDVPLERVLETTGAERVVLLEETAPGDDTLESALTQDVPQDADAAVLIGGFAHGSLQSDLSRVPTRSVRLGDAPLAAWTVTAEAVVRYRQATRNHSPM